MRTGRFKVYMDDLEVPGWRTVTIPPSRTEQGEYRDGEGDRERRLWGRTTYDDLTMERGVPPGDTTLHDWREQIRAG